MNGIALPLLTLTVAFAPVLGFPAQPATDQANAAVELKRLGAKVTVDDNSPGKLTTSASPKG
jgi:hypothetical protein